MMINGQTVLHYKIIDKLGEGGMGVVYKAEDTTLHRTVALKFLPEKASGSPQDKARFMVEARAAANLNHPNICTIHAIEEFEGQTFIAMECVDGATLREKIPYRMLNAAYDAAIQIGEALSEAHAKGIVHRDVKSENIMITPRGQIKVMDFGLAKLKGSLKLTRTSSTVGTLGYMSPEQIQGGEVDHRSDIFSLGVVFFEMLSGQLPFRGEHEAAMVYSIVNEQPKRITDLLKDAPQALEEIFAKAFEKDPNERYQSAADFAVDLKRLKKQSSQSRSRASMPAVRSGGAEGPGDRPGVSPDGGDRGTDAGPRSAGKRPDIRFIVTALLLVVSLAYIGYRTINPGDGAEAGGMTFSRITELAGAELFPDVSPDGNYIVYVRWERDRSDIFTQRIGGGNPISLTASSGSRNIQPAYSPNGDLIAFRSDREGGGIFLMGSTGESVRRLTDFGFNPSWSPDGRQIVVATESVEHPFARSGESKLFIIDAESGTATMLYKGDGVQPRWSPDGSRIAFWGLPTGTGRRELWTIAPSGGAPAKLTDDEWIDWSPAWSPDGGTLYFLSDRGGPMNAWKVAIDLGSGMADGNPVPVTLPTQNCAALRVSSDGKKIIYASSEARGNIQGVPFDPARLKLAGPPFPVTEGSRRFEYPSVSPDGARIAFTLRGEQEDIGIIGADGRGFRKLTNDRAKDRGPAWSPDGRQIAFYSERSGTYQIWTVNADGSGFRQLTDHESKSTIAYPLWLPRSGSIYYQMDTSGATLPVAGQDGANRRGHRPLPQYKDNLVFSGSSISPDGLHLAGGINYPDGAGRGLALFSFVDSLFTTLHDAGTRPFWLRDGRTLLFLDDGSLKLLDVPSKRVTVLEGLPPVPEDGYAISPDNRTLYIVKAEAESDIWEARLP